MNFFEGKNHRKETPPARESNLLKKGATNVLFPILLFGIMQQFKDLGALLVFEYSSQFKPAIAFSH